MRRTIGTARQGKAPATADIICEMLKLAPDTVIGVRTPRCCAWDFPRRKGSTGWRGTRSRGQRQMPSVEVERAHPLVIRLTPARVEGRLAIEQAGAALGCTVLGLPEYEPVG